MAVVAQEEQQSLRKKLERMKKIEMASSADEVLQEEIREYKVRVVQVQTNVKMLLFDNK